MSRNPYMGLRPYSEADAPLFFGRGALVNSLNDDLLTENRLVALTGAAGTGKTSVGNALVAALRQDGGKWKSVYLAIEDQPLRQTAIALSELTGGTDQLSRIYGNPEALAEIMGEISADGTRLMFVFDSFENLFVRVSIGERVYFLDALYRALTRTASVCRICVLIRDDFRDRLMEYPQWAELLSERIRSMPELTADDLEEIIRLPAQSEDIEIEDALVERLIQDVKHTEASRILPALSFTLSNLYERGDLNLAAYEQLGNVSGVIAQVAEAVYGTLTALQQLVARRVLLQSLVTIDNGEPLTRPVERTRLQFNWVGQEDVDYTLGQLLSAGLLTERGGADLMLSHECLTREWPRYAIWIQEETESLRYASELEQLASTWVTREYSEQALLRGAALDEALSWLANPDNLPSALLESYISVSGHLRQNQATQQERQARTSRWGGRSVALALLVVTGLLAIISLFAFGTVGERDTLATQQAVAAARLVTSTAQGAAMAATISAGQTRQAEAQAVIATSAAEAQIAATQQAIAQASLDAASTQQAALQATAAAAQAVAQSTIDGYAAQIAANATSVASVSLLQATLDAAIQQQLELRLYLAGQLAEEVPNVLNTDPKLALYLAAEAGTISSGANAGDIPDARINMALREALKANMANALGSGAVKSWIIGNSYAVVSYADNTSRLWRLTPAEAAADFTAPIEQIIPIADGKLFVVDYADDTADELWNAETGAAVGRFSGDIAPAETVVDNRNRNIIELQGGAFFTVKYEEARASELWESTTGTRKAVLDGDLERVVELDNGYFFADYAEADEIGRLWEMASGQPIMQAEDILSAPFDNSVFALRQKDADDEIWLTDPLKSIITVTGKVDTVRTLFGTDYFVIQYEGEKPAEIWKFSPAAELLVTLKGQVDISTTYLDGQYFFIRYSDFSASELWRTDPLEVAARLNGHLDKMNIDLTLGGEVAIVAYEDNSISEVWSLPEADRIAPLTGSMVAVKPVLGDTAFIVRYAGNLPSEVWTSADARRIARLSESQQAVLDIRTIKDGAYTVVLYEEVPAEVWSVTADNATLLATLPDVTTQIYLLEGGDYFIANYANRAAQIWEVTRMAPIATLLGTVTQYTYAGADQILSYTTPDNQTYTLDFGTLAALSSDQITAADLLKQACDRLEGSQPAAQALAPYLGGQSSVACGLGVATP